MTRVGLLVFPQVEVLDFAGPFEVFSLATDAQGQRAFAVEVLGVQTEAGGLVTARNGLRVQADRPYTEAGDLDLVVVPGGWGAERVVIEDRAFLAWLALRASRGEALASICTGAFLLAEAGILQGRQATTHHLDFAEFAQRWPGVTLVTNRRWVDEGPVATSGGISAGIDLSLHLVARWAGIETARRTAARMEYRWEEAP